MHILLLQNKTKTDNYADFLLQLLLQSLSEQNYSVIKTDSFSKAKKINLQEGKVVIHIDFNKVKSPLFSKYKLHFLAKKQKIKWVVQVTDNKSISSRFPQLIISNNVEKLIAKKTPSSVSFAVCSHIAKQKLIDTYNLQADNVWVIPAIAGSNFQPISWSDKQSVKMQYTQGREYFLADANGKTIDSFISLLKAFSIFKKWQHSSMKLVVRGKLYFTGTKEWNEKISSYKYRDDIVITNEWANKEHIALLAGAYVFLHTPLPDSDVIPLLQAMQCETPCISFITDSITEYAHDAAVLIDQNNYEQLGEKMILLYKDETLRSQLVEKGKQWTQHYTIINALTHLKSAMPLDIH